MVDWEAIASEGSPSLVPGPAAPVPSRRHHAAPRPPARFRERVLAQLLSAANLKYLRGVVRKTRASAGLPRDRALAELPDALDDFCRGAAFEAVGDDPLALRGRLEGGPTFWSEVRRLNAMFLQNVAPALGGGVGTFAADESGYVETPDISRRIFEKTILRPPGREHLNGPGPLWQQREYQGLWDGPGAAAGTDGGAAGVRGATPKQARGSYSGIRADNPYGVSATARGHLDSTLRAKDLLTPSYEEAGSHFAPYDVAEPGTDPADRILGDVYAWGDTWHRSGSEFNRWRGIPVWQKTGRRFVSDDEYTESTLGLGERESGGIFRRFDMGRMRANSVYRPGGPMCGGTATPSTSLDAATHPVIGTVGDLGGRGAAIDPISDVARGAMYGYPV